MSTNIHREITLALANNRVLMLVHALLILEAGLAIFLFGAPLSAYLEFGKYAHVLFGLPAIAAGVSLLAGASLPDGTRAAWALRVGGFLGVTAWGIGMSLLFAKTALTTETHLLAFSPENDPAALGRPYVPLVYVNVGLLALVHLITLLRLGWRRSWR